MTDQKLFGCVRIDRFEAMSGLPDMPPIDVAFEGVPVALSHAYSSFAISLVNCTTSVSVTLRWRCAALYHRWHC